VVARALVSHSVDLVCSVSPSVSLLSLFFSPPLFTIEVMVPHCRCPSHHVVIQSRAAKVAKGAVTSYSNTIPEVAQAAMKELEEEVQLIHEFKEDDEVEKEVGGMVLDLGCTRTHNSIFFRIVELYWHTKSMVSLGMFPRTTTSGS
jgi:hypothetical protein